MKNLPVILLCAMGLFGNGSLLAGQLKVVELSTAATSGEVSNARKALTDGSVVVMRLVDPAQFNAFLAVRGASITGTDEGANREPRACLAAAYVGRGVVSTFIGPPVVGGHRPEREQCDAAFGRWLLKQDLLGSAPDPDTWTEQGTSSRSFGQFTLDVSIYRATSDALNSAYYLYTTEMTDQTASSSVKTCSINMQGLQLPNQLPPSVFDYGKLASSPGTPSVVGTFVPSSEGITPYQPDNWSGNQSAISYTGTSQAATWSQQYNSGEGPTEVRVASAIFEVSRPSPVSIEIVTQCTDGTTSSSQSDITYSIAAPDLDVPKDVYVVAGNSLTFSAVVEPSRNTSFDWSPTLSSSNITLTQNVANITVSAPVSALGTTTGINYAIDPAWATTTINPTTLVHVVSTPPAAGVLLAGGYDANNEPLATADVWDANTGQVTPANNSMSTARWRHTATPLDATHILIAGGFGGVNNAAQASTDIYDVTTGLFTAGPNMTSARAGHTATVLTGPVSGRQFVVLAGGVDENQSPVGTLDIYDIGAGSFLPSVPMALARWNHTAAAPTNQQIVIAGGSQSMNPVDAALAATEVCSINSADTISCGAAAGMQNGRQGHATTVFDYKTGQTVYVFGGFDAAQADFLNCTDPLCSFESSGGASGQFFYYRYYSEFTSILPSHIGRRYPAVLSLPASTQFPVAEPRFLFVGGYNTAQQVQACTFLTGLACDGGFGNAASLTTVRAYPVALTLPFTGTSFDNQVLISGGVDLSAVPSSDTGTEIELYNPAQNTVTVSGFMSSPRTFLTSTSFQVLPSAGTSK
jgi:hypothetical protein